MSTAQTWQTTSTSADATFKLAEQIGRNMRGGETVELVSDLGGGKTAFVRGLAAGIGSKDPVRSPSFTISNEYRSSKLTLYHFDFYRLFEPGIIREALTEALHDPRAIVAVEWPALVENVLPADRLTIFITATGPDTRELTFSYPTKFHYLFPDNT